ncbi:MAG: NCS2 family permease [Defluviitaleaceae bacterium]|nr:NCS2 family permease [Defluviitaleaceae bacterium]
MEKLFKIKARKSSISREFIAGLTTFLAMGYIIFVNPQILGVSGMDQGAVFTATILVTIIGTLIMGFLANYPVAVSPGMGINAFFAYTVVLGMGFTWQQALAGAFISGILFLIISLTKLRTLIIDSIPTSLKHAVGVGIGLFIMFIGLQNSGVVVSHPATLVTLNSFTDRGVLLTVIGLVVTLVLLVKKVPAAIFIGMVVTVIVGMFMGVITWPDQIIQPIPSLEPTFGAFWNSMPDLLTFEMIPIIFAFLFVDFFDTAGTLMSIATRAGLLDSKGNLIDGKKAVVADASSTVIGAVVGTSPTASYIESLTGIEAGGRTGLTAIFVSIFFAAMLFFSGLLGLVTPEVTAPALITVGILMASSLKNIEWNRLEIAIPAFMTIAIITLSYSIADGIAAGFLLYPITMLFAGKRKEVHPVMWGLAVIFLLHFALA